MSRPPRPSRAPCLRPVATLVCALLVLAWPAPEARAEEAAIWSVEGREGRLLLLGSVHLLRTEDYPLPANVGTAYERADRLVMELDESDLDPLAVQSLLIRYGRLEGGRTLADVMGPRDYGRAQRLAQELGYPLDLLGPVKPWLAAVTIMNLHTIEMGYSPVLGLEQHLAGRARKDGKPIEGLETVEFQLELFDGLPEATQSRLLLQTLEEASLMGAQLATLIAAWRRGDSAELNRELTRSFRDYPEVYRRLVTERNRSWAQRLGELADQAGVTLVVVGALHLVGDDSVVQILSRRGLRVERWRPES